MKNDILKVISNTAIRFLFNVKVNVVVMTWSHIHVMCATNQLRLGVVAKKN